MESTLIWTHIHTFGNQLHVLSADAIKVPGRSEYALYRCEHRGKLLHAACVWYPHKQRGSIAGVQLDEWNKFSLSGVVISVRMPFFSYKYPGREALMTLSVYTFNLYTWIRASIAMLLSLIKGWQGFAVPPPSEILQSLPRSCPCSSSFRLYSFTDSSDLYRLCVIYLCYVMRNLINTTLTFGYWN